MGAGSRIFNALASAGLAAIVATGCSQSAEVEVATDVEVSTEDGASTEATAVTTAPATSIPVTESTESSTVPAGLSLTELLDGSTLATASTRAGSFISVGDGPEGDFRIVGSDDGERWTLVDGELTGLPAELAGPYRLWPFGDGYMLYGSSGFEDEELLGEDPFVAISADLFAWEEIELPGIDQLFYNGWQNAHGRGDVSADGSIGLFAGSNRAFESGVGGSVLWAVRPGEAPVLLENPEGVYTFAFVQGNAIGLARQRSGDLQLFVLDGAQWQPLPAPPANPQLGPELRAVGKSLLVLNAGESWSTTDFGGTWSQIPTVSSELRSFGYFGAFVAGGPVEPPFGTPEYFRTSTNGSDWTNVALPEGASSIRHLVSNEQGLLSLVEFNGPQRFETVLTSE